jgi:hypothetical protein
MCKPSAYRLMHLVSYFSTVVLYGRIAFSNEPVQPDALPCGYFPRRTGTLRTVAEP